MLSYLKKRIRINGEMKGMKSHDYHLMIQEIFPLCMQHLMVKGCRMAMIHLWCVFLKTFAKIVDPTIIGELKKKVAMTLVLLEQEFPPLFFDIMTHLLIHLVEELEICDLVHTRWMYPIERYLKTLKGYVCNKARPKGSTVEGYAFEEALGFCTEYLQDFTTIQRKVWDEKEDQTMFDEMFEGNGRPCVMNCRFPRHGTLFCASKCGTDG
jgi:hypothetical protein